jgi:hypothetical protein
MVISVKEMGLSRFAFDDLLWVVGMNGKEAIGGEAHLTSYRIVFKSHFANRARGTHSIFLPNVVRVSPTFNRLTVETKSQSFEFVMWFKKEFANAIHEQQARITMAGLEDLKQGIAAHPEVIGDGLQKCVSLESLNQILLGARKIYSVLEKFSIVEKSTFLEVLELLKPDESG